MKAAVKIKLGGPSQDAKLDKMREYQGKLTGLKCCYGLGYM